MTAISAARPVCSPKFFSYSTSLKCLPFLLFFADSWRFLTFWLSRPAGSRIRLFDRALTHQSIFMHEPPSLRHSPAEYFLSDVVSILATRLAPRKTINELDRVNERKDKTLERKGRIPLSRFYFESAPSYRS